MMPMVVASMPVQPCSLDSQSKLARAQRAGSEGLSCSTTIQRAPQSRQICHNVRQSSTPAPTSAQPSSSSLVPGWRDILHMGGDHAIADSVAATPQVPHRRAPARPHPPATSAGCLQPRQTAVPARSSRRPSVSAPSCGCDSQAGSPRRQSASQAHPVRVQAHASPTRPCRAAPGARRA